MYNEVRKIDLLSGDTLKTFAQGALGAMTFGAYHQYTTNKMMELNNENQDLQHKYFMDKMEAQYAKYIDKMEAQHTIKMNELQEKMDKLYNEVKNNEVKNNDIKQKRGWLW